ncbi:MAG: hypothetical protein COW03_02575 [Cytophagales bacterium CG12_big_fil_rev_8_21_14_0_65_40_12]|nr:MAG: hypothetical protein COW03_02575 [Cytophagales bacterium CG12_big_fil_rev_8_21_14_0_65_40_12]PIW03428.1 MAG: hypothetical protein COW40_14820 [Cytophagales bacterium CG17_big_fil_post_rev_8_21_14_2_50_40_13]
MGSRVIINRVELKSFMNYRLLPIILLYNIIFVILYFDFITLNFYSLIEDISIHSVLYVLLKYLLFMVAWIVGIFIHEFIHGFTFALFGKYGFKSVRFGIEKGTFLFYTSFLEPLPKFGFIVGGIMPSIILGVIPAILALIFGDFVLALFGSIFLYGAGGDFLMVEKALKIKGSYLFGGENDESEEDFLGFDVTEREVSHS